jgi:hypothetical protein
MRSVGLVVLLAALGVLAYALLALARNRGSHGLDGHLLAGLSIVMAAGATGMIARKSWGGVLCAAVATTIMVMAVLGLLVNSFAPSTLAPPIAKL